MAHRMFFLFRAFFWLALIMTVIWWSSADVGRKPGAAETVRKETAGQLPSFSALAGKSFEEAKSRLQQACLQRPKLCIELLSQYTRSEAERPQTNMPVSGSANKPNAEAKHQGRAAQTAPQGRDPAN